MKTFFAYIAMIGWILWVDNHFPDFDTIILPGLIIITGLSIIFILVRRYLEGHRMHQDESEVKSEQITYNEVDVQPVPEEKKKRGRPKGSKNKPKISS